MTILFKTGAWTSRTSTGTDVITGVGFTPKIILCFSSAHFASDNAFASDYNFRFGAAVDTTAANQYALYTYSTDAQATSNTESSWWASAVQATEAGLITTLKGVVSAISSDGFTVNWTSSDGSAHRIFFICIGGTDITNTKTGEITGPSATGNQSYTGIGFKPDFVMFWGSDITSDNHLQNGASFSMGFGTSSSNQVALANAQKHAVTTKVAKRYQRGDNVTTYIVLQGGTPTAGALGGSIVSLDSDGFTINWTTCTGSGVTAKVGYLAVKGASWKVGVATGGTASTSTVTGLPFQPAGIIIASACNSNSAAISANARISFGGGSSSSDSRCVFSGDTDAVSTSVSACIQKSAKCISVITENATATSSTVSAEAAISTMNSDGFTLSWSTTGATAYEYLYVAIGPTGATNQNITKTLSESIAVTHNTPTFVKTPAPKLRTLTETITFSDTGQPTKRMTKIRSPTPEAIVFSDNVTKLKSHVGANNVAKTLTENLTLSGTPTNTPTRGIHNLIKTLTETIHFSDSVTYVGKTKHTGDPGYWLPQKPRINIFAFNDTTYSSPLYTYNAFTDGSGGIDKPIALQFTSDSVTAGTFSLQIDNSNDTYDLDQFARGNRITIELSKDSQSWSTAYHGLVRSVKQKVFGPNNRTIFIEGYSYLIRLSERILSVKKQAALIGGDFDRTDTNMFTGNLLNDLLTNDINYVNSVDDTQLYSVFKTNNLAGSPIDDWVPRIDAQLTTLNETINNILEYSQSLVTLDFSNDQLVLFNPDRVPSGGANAFLVTDNLVLQGDSSLNTMYPIADYTYQISYDFADSANRLIASIGSVQCPETIIDSPPPLVTPDYGYADITTWSTSQGFWEPALNSAWSRILGCPFKCTANPITQIKVAGLTRGNPYTSENRMYAEFRVFPGTASVGATISGSGFNMYVGGKTTNAIPKTTSGTNSPQYAWQTPPDYSYSGLTVGTTYWIMMNPIMGLVGNAQDSNNQLEIGWNNNGDRYAIYSVYSNLAMSVHLGAGTDPQFAMQAFMGSSTGGGTSTAIPPCGGLPEPRDADPVLAIASDKNMEKRIGMVEQSISNIPPHVKTLQTMNEYLFNKLYVMGRPRFTFDYPALTLPSVIPKAGDICVHVSKKAQVGRARTPVQTGIITQVTYDFGQDSDSILGLRKIGLTTNGVLRGSY
jgi:hypothetical protein